MLDRALRVLGWSLCATALVACGTEGDGSGSGAGTGASGAGSTTGAGTGGAASAVESFCGTVAAPFCDALFACCPAPEVLGQYGASAEECAVTRRAECLDTDAYLIGPLVAAGRSELVLARLQTCIQQLESMAMGASACDRSVLQYFQFVCLGAFVGQVPPGETCGEESKLNDISFVECASGLCANGSCDPFVAEGEDCVPGASGCDYTLGQGCIYDGVTATCGPVGTVGEWCAELSWDKEGGAYHCWTALCGDDGLCAAPPESVRCAGS